MSESLKSDVMACKSKIPPVTKVVKAPATEEEKKQAVAMYKMGKGVCEIARETGRAQSTISRWVGTSVPKKQASFGDIIRKAGREHAIVDGECTDEFDKEFDEVEMTIKKASVELKTEKSKSKTLMQAVEGIEPKHDYKAEFEESQKKNEFTKADIIKAIKYCQSQSSCDGCPLNRLPCKNIKDDYILSTENDTRSDELSADEIARKFEMYEEDLKTAEKMINGKSYSEAVCGMMTISGIMETVSKLPKSERRIELLDDCETVMSKGFTRFNELDAEKEPATVVPATSSNEIKSTESITLSKADVKRTIEMLHLAGDTLNQIYKSNEFNKLNTRLAVGFGRAWAVIDMVVDLLEN